MLYAATPFQLLEILIAPLFLQLYLFKSCDNITFLSSRCTSVAWVPQGNGVFVVAHADGNLYMYEKASFIQVDFQYSVLPAIHLLLVFSLKRTLFSLSFRGRMLLLIRLSHSSRT